MTIKIWKRIKLIISKKFSEDDTAKLIIHDAQFITHKKPILQILFKVFLPVLLSLFKQK